MMFFRREKRRTSSKMDFIKMKDGDLLIFKGKSGNILRRRVLGFDDDLNPIVNLSDTRTPINPIQFIKFERRFESG